MSAELGQGALWVALALGAAAAASAAGELRGGAWARWTPRLLLAAAGAAALGFTTLIWLFLTSDLSTAAVFFYSRTDLDWPWKLAGVWAGRHGSLLLWAMLMTIVAAAVAWLDARRSADSTDEAEQRGRRWTRLFLSLASLAFLAAAAGQGTFDATNPSLLAGRPLGNGLNPTLRNGFILIHPPLMFLAYALATVPAAAALGHLASGTDRWSRIAFTPSRLGWLLFTVAMSLGAMWAYTTLGFGGYWAWDPVEVANLLPWLALTLYLHAQIRHKADGAYATAGPLLAVLPFLLSLFSTLSTRSGLWVSVHAFTDPTDAFEPDAARRFLDILAAEPSLLFYCSLLLATLLLFLALWCHRLARDTGRLTAAAPWLAGLLAALAAWAALDPASLFGGAVQLAHDISGGNTAYGLLGLAFALFLLGAAPALAASSEGKRPRGMAAFAAYAVLALTLALLVLVLFHFAAVNGWSTAFYEARFPFLALPVVLGLLVFQAHAQLGRSGLWLAAATAVAALAAWRTLGLLWLLLLPSLVLVAVSLARVRASLGGRSLGSSLLLLGALADLLFWSNPPTDLIAVPWPLQVVLLLASAAALVLSARVAAGAAPALPAALLVAMLGGYLVAPGLAVAGLLLLRRAPVEAAKPAVARTRLATAALHSLHLAVAILLVGYATSTYAKAETRAELELGEPAAVGGFNLTFTSAQAIGPAFGSATALRPAFDWTAASSSGRLEGVLDWEAQVQAHMPLPAIARTWTSDLYVEVEAIHVAPGPCAPGEPDGYWLQAYQGQVPSRACSGAALDGVKVRALELPGLALLWGAVALAVVALAVRMAPSRGREP